MLKTSTHDAVSIRKSFLEQAFLVIGIYLAIYSIAQVGYYVSFGQTDFLIKGYKDIDLGENQFLNSNSLSFIGTMASILCVMTILIYINNLHVALKLQFNFLLVLFYILITSLYSNALIYTILMTLKSAIFATAVTLILLKVNVKILNLAIIILCVTIVSLSIIFSFIDPRLNNTFGVAGIRGLFSHKNSLGVFCYWSTVLILGLKFFLPTARAFPLLSNITILLLGLCLYLSQSKTSLVLYFLLLFGYSSIDFLKRHLNIKSAISLFFAGASFVVPVLIMVYLVILPDADISLTGRTNIWSRVLDFIGERWIFGFGGLSFPGDSNLTSILYSNFGVTAIDSSYVYILFNFGIVGIAVYFYLIISYTNSKNIGSGFFLYMVLACATYLIHGLTEVAAGINYGYPQFVLNTLFVLSLLANKSGNYEGQGKADAPFGFQYNRAE